MQTPGVKVKCRPFTGALADQLQKPHQNRSGVSLYWLGQAGFVIDTPDLRLVIDPYLSDSLAVKYRSSRFSHERMAPAPIHPDDLGHVDYVLCTHHHTDHMDGTTLARLAERLPDLRFVVPEASRELALDRIRCEPDRLVPLDAGQSLDLAPSATLSVMRSAHETLEQTESGAFRFLSYGLNLNGIKLFHSGDTVPFAGQEDEIRSFGPDVDAFTGQRAQRRHVGGRFCREFHPLRSN